MTRDGFHPTPAHDFEDTLMGVRFTGVDIRHTPAMPLVQSPRQVAANDRAVGPIESPAPAPPAAMPPLAMPREQGLLAHRWAAPLLMLASAIAVLVLALTAALLTPPVELGSVERTVLSSASSVARR